MKNHLSTNLSSSSQYISSSTSSSSSGTTPTISTTASSGTSASAAVALAPGHSHHESSSSSSSSTSHASTAKPHPLIKGVTLYLPKGAVWYWQSDAVPLPFEQIVLAPGSRVSLPSLTWLAREDEILTISSKAIMDWINSDIVSIPLIRKITWSSSSISITVPTDETPLHGAEIDWWSEHSS